MGWLSSLISAIKFLLKSILRFADVKLGNIILKALLCIDSIASDKYVGISSYTCAAYSTTDLTLQRYTLTMSFGITPARFSNLSANNLFAALAIIYSTCAFHLRSSLIITPRSLYVPTRSTSLYPTHIGRNEVMELVIKSMNISLHFFGFNFILCSIQ